MHTILRPSSADIWYHCAAQPSIMDRLAIESATSDEAMEGTCAAWVAEMVLTKQVDSCADLVGELHPENNWPVDHVMANHIQGYVDMIVVRGGIVGAERRVYLTQAIQGTPDAYAVVQRSSDGNHNTKLTLYVDDLKYGYSIVSPRSKQVLIYTGAIFNELAAQGHAPDKIQIGIYQPRGFHVDGIYRTRTLTPDQLRDEIDDIIRAGDRTFNPQAFATPGSHCKHCDVNTKCAAVTNELYDIYSMMLGTQARHMSGDELANELRFLHRAYDMVKGRKSAVESEINGMMDDGKFVPGWVRERGYGHRRFNVSKAAVHALTGIDPTGDKMMSPAQLENAGASKAMVEAITEKPRTKAKLVPLTTEDIAKQFGE
jgi:hypothetical protein